MNTDTNTEAQNMTMAELKKAQAKEAKEYGAWIEKTGGLAGHRDQPFSKELGKRLGMKW